MRVAIAADSGWVSQHFGRCPEYRIFDVENGKITKQTILKSPGHEPGALPRLLISHGVNCVIAGAMGPSAVNLFRQNNVQVVTGANGRVEDVIKAYIDGTLEMNESPCEHEK